MVFIMVYCCELFKVVVKYTAVYGELRCMLQNASVKH